MEHRTRTALLRLTAALVAALLALMPCASAEAAEPAVENVDAFVEELMAFDLDDEAVPNAEEAAEPPVTDEPAPSEYEADYTLQFTANRKLTVCQGDVVAIECSRMLLQTPESNDPAVAEVVEADLPSGRACLLAAGVGKAIVSAKLSPKKTVRLTLTVVPRNMPVSVRFTQKKITLNGGERCVLNLECTPTTARPVYAWRSSNPRVATVSEDGTVTAVEGAQGTAKITAMAQNGRKATVSVKVVNPNKPKSVAFESERYVMSLGETSTFAPALSPADARSTYTWKSSKPRVASVDDDGRVTAHTTGKTKLTVRTSNGKTASATIEVQDLNRPTGFALMLNHDRLLEEGETIPGDVGYYLTLTATLTPETAHTTYTCTVSDESILKVVHYSSEDPNIYIGVAAAGTATVTVETGNGLTASAVVEATDPKIPTSVAIREGNHISIDVGGTRTLTAVLNDDEAVATYAWSTSDPGVAQVISDSPNSPVCSVTAVGYGTATVTVETDNGLSAACAVTVNQPGTRYRALLIAEDDFYWSPEEGWNRGNMNRGAAEKMKAALNGVSGPTGEKYDVTVKLNTDLAGTEAAIAEAFAGADDDDVSLFYFASHGDSESTDEYAGAMVMASLTEKYPETMRIDRLARLLSAVPGRVIVLIDTCGSGATVTAKGGADFAAARKACAAFDAAVVAAFAERDAGVSDGVAPKIGELRVANKFYVLCSSRYLEFSWSYHAGQDGGSYFTDWLVEGIGRSGDMPADQQFGGNDDGVADLYELYRYIAGVGDTFAIPYEGVDYYQHVQVYPADTRYEMFR